MSLRSLLFGSQTQAASLLKREEQFKNADTRLKEMAYHREEIRKQLSDAMRQIIEDQGA
jgi:uncharacterized membrane-anchored protein